MSMPPKVVRLCPWVLGDNGPLKFAILEHGACAHLRRLGRQPGRIDACKGCKGALRYVEEKT